MAQKCTIVLPMYICTSSHFLAKNGSFLKIAQSLNHSKISPKLPTYLGRYLPNPHVSFQRPTYVAPTWNSEALFTSSQQPWNLLRAGFFLVARLQYGSFLADADLAGADAVGFGARGRRCCGFCGFWRIAAVFGGSSVSGRGRFRPF